MPTVKGKKYPYTKKGMMDAKKAINEDDARGYRKRVAKAKRIKGETVVPEKTKKYKIRKPTKPKFSEQGPKKKGEPPNRKYRFGPGNARNKDYPGLFDPKPRPKPGKKK